MQQKIYSGFMSGFLNASAKMHQHYSLKRRFPFLHCSVEDIPYPVAHVGYTCAYLKSVKN